MRTYLTIIRRYTHFFVVAAIVSGCSDPEGQVAPGGGMQEAVSYEPPPNPQAARVNVAPVRIEGELALAAIPTMSAAPGDPLAICGALDVPGDNPKGAIVHVQFFQTLPNGIKVISQAGLASATKPDDDGHRFPFRIDVKAPQRKGKHSIELLLTHPMSDRTNVPIATGEIEIR